MTTSKPIHVELSCLILLLGATACDSSGSDDPAKPEAKAAALDASPPSRESPAADAPPPPEQPARLQAVDLASVGDAWKGYRIEAPAGTVPGDDGAGGVSIAMKGGVQATLMKGPAPMDDVKTGAQAGAEAAEGSVSFTTETPQVLEYVMDVQTFDGKAAKVHGFAQTFEFEGETFGCMGAGYEQEAQLEQAKAVCTSLAKS